MLELAIPCREWRGFLLALLAAIATFPLIVITKYLCANATELISLETYSFISSYLIWIPFLVFDACWLAWLNGGRWHDIWQRSTLSYFLKFVIASVMTPALFDGIIYISKLPTVGLHVPWPDGPTEAALNLHLLWGLIAFPAMIFALYARIRIMLWPIHVLTTGRLTDFVTPWRAATGSLVEIIAQLIGVGLVVALISAVPAILAYLLSGETLMYWIFTLAIFYFLAVVDAVLLNYYKAGIAQQNTEAAPVLI